MATLTRTLDGRTLARRAGIVALLGAASLAVGLALDPARTYFAYLMAYAFAMSTVLGALFMLLIGHAVRASWVLPLRRVNEMVAWAVLPLAVLFLPLAFGPEHVYPWAQPDPDLGQAAQALLDRKRAYLNADFFRARAAIYFAIWVGTIWILRRRSLRRDRAHVAASAPHTAGLTWDAGFSAAALIPVSFCTTFSAFDWLMSLQPEWYSTMFGVYYFAGGFVAGLSLLAVLSGRARALVPDAIRAPHFHALGRMVLGFLVFWAYCSFFQALLIALADKPDEVVFYTERLAGSWSVFVPLLSVGHFALPFALLLPRRGKSRFGYLAGVSAWVLLMHLAESYWLVMPLHDETRALPHFQELGALAWVVGVCVAFVALSHHNRPLLTVGDPQLARGIRYQGAR